jgi:hypothetical protein
VTGDVSNRTLLREVNERIAELTAADGAVSVVELLCECGDDDCTLTVRLSRRTYERLRSRGEAFLVDPRHAGRSDGSAVEREGRRVAVERFVRAA